MISRLSSLVLVALAISAIGLPAHAQKYGMAPLTGPSNTLPRQLEEVTVEEHLGEMLPLDVELVNHEGETVRLGDYFHKERPVLINLVYYGCPMLCGLVLNGMVKGLAQVEEYMPGRDYEIVTVTIDPSEGTALAREKRETMLEMLGHEGVGGGWSFHTASETEVRRLADALGFQYQWDEKGKQWAHPAVIFWASPEGKITRYLYGIEYPPFDLKMAVLESGEGKVGNTLQKLMLFCFHYDSDAQGYRIARTTLKIGATMTMIAVFGFLAILWRRSETRRSKES